MLIMVVYSSLTSAFLLLELLVLFILLGTALVHSPHCLHFLLLVLLYLLTQALVSWGAYTLNRNYMAQKDNRLSINVAGEPNGAARQR